MADNVVLMKLVSSEEIICVCNDADDSTETFYTIKNPFCIAPSLSASDGGKVSVYPWSLATVIPSETTYTLDKRFVMFKAPAPERLATSYAAQMAGLITTP